MTDTVAQHIGEYAKDGTLARSCGNSMLTVQNIMDAGRLRSQIQAVFRVRFVGMSQKR